MLGALRAQAFFGLTFAGLAALATLASVRPCFAGPVDLDTAVMMASEMGKSVNVLSREVTTYHWQPRFKVGLPLLGEVDPRDPRGLSYFKGVAGSFWANIDSPGLMMGNGLYVATDPIESQMYGGGNEEWALLTVSLKAGTRLFDGREYVMFTDALRSRLAALGCPSWQSGTEIFANYVLPNEICANTFRQALRILGVQGTVYEWGGVSLAACKLRGNYSGPAMVLYDPALASGVHILVKNIPADDPAEIHDLRIRVTHFFHLSQGVQGIIIGWAGDPWPSLSSSEQPADLIEWIQSHTYFCDSNNWEDLLPSQLVFSPSELVEKQEEIGEKAALVSTRAGRAIRPEAFRGILAGQYYTANELKNGPVSQLLAAPEFTAWVRVQTQQIQQAARNETPLSVQMISQWARGWSAPGGEAPVVRPDREQALELLLSELNAALFHPRQASLRDKPLLRDAEALIRTYSARFTALAPLTSQNDRLANAVVSVLAIVRGWPPVLLRLASDQLSTQGAFKAVIIMDKCLDKYARGAVSPGTDCDMLEVQP